ncbi:hypothetical protein, conserved [Eimeria necatrix]|uniref:Uncharacterized protein n=1 Tax=Eimeria necatrix TaxID=51315 RepID=U6MLK4_9EIME|nr:hypothetical protein, conserved [Eimeria necatrix]CDJ63963.1 hypothetical protein, conserved [Eimeria necatrix]
MGRGRRLLPFCPVLAFLSDGGRILLLAFPWNSSVNERIVELRPHPRDEPIAALAWSPCDEFLTVALRDGSVVTFAWPRRLLFSACKGSVLMSRSLNTLVLCEPSGEEAVFSLSNEPDKVFLGPRHCAAACGRELIIYTRKSQGGVALLGTLCLPSPVQLIGFGLEYAVIVFEGQTAIMPLEPNGAQINSLRPLHRRNSSAKMKEATLAAEMLREGQVAAVASASWCLGLSLGGEARDVFWDGKHSDVLVIVTSLHQAVPFICCSKASFSEEQAFQVPVLQLQGSHAVEVGLCCIDLEDLLFPIALINGVLLSISTSGNLTSLCLDCLSCLHQTPHYHTSLNNSAEPSSLTIRYVLQLLALGRDGEALQALEGMLGVSPVGNLSATARDCFEAVGWHALDRLDINVACRSFKAAKRCDLVPWLCTLEEVEEDVALGAHMKALHHNWREAVELLMCSSDPEAALDIACQLEEWHTAIDLAKVG